MDVLSWVNQQVDWRLLMVALEISSGLIGSGGRVGVKVVRAGWSWGEW